MLKEDAMMGSGWWVVKVIMELCGNFRFFFGQQCHTVHKESMV